MSHINLRSPYFVINQEANLTQCDLTVYVHTGAQSSTTTGAQYSLSSTAITPASGNPYTVFDISELARDYIESTFSGTYSCTTVWVNYQITRYISSVAQTPSSVVQLTGFDGYHYFEDGEQSSATSYTAPNLLQSNTVIYKHDDAVVRIPVLQDNVTDVTFLNKGQIVNELAITPALTTSTSVIRYVANTGASYDTFKARVEADGGTLEESCLGNVFNRYSYAPADAVLLETSSGVTRIAIKDIEACKYTPYKLTFINKFGALQDLWFFSLSKESLSVQSDTYKANILSIGSYSINDRQNVVMTRNGTESISMNSGWYPESYNEVFRQLMLSEEVWIDYDSNILPVNVSSNGMEFKKHVNDKLINYNISVEFANNKINSVR